MAQELFKLLEIATAYECFFDKFQSLNLNFIDQILSVLAPPFLP